MADKSEDLLYKKFLPSESLTNKMLKAVYPGSFEENVIYNCGDRIIGKYTFDDFRVKMGGRLEGLIVNQTHRVARSNMKEGTNIKEITISEDNSFTDEFIEELAERIGFGKEYSQLYSKLHEEFFYYATLISGQPRLWGGTYETGVDKSIKIVNIEEYKPTPMIPFR